MNIYILPDGSLVVPGRAQSGTIKGDGMMVIVPNHPDHAKWITWLERNEQQAELIPSWPLPPATNQSAALTLDQQGHEHRGKGDPRGGQFAPKGQGGDTNSGKIKEPDHTKPKSSPKTTPGTSESSSNLHSLTDDQIYNGTFTQVSMGRSIHAAQIGVVEVGDQKLFYKGIRERGARKEELASKLFALADLRAPMTRIAPVNGAPIEPGSPGGVLSEWIDGKTVTAELGSESDSFTKLEERLLPGEVDKHILFSFLIGLEDRTLNNYMVEGNRLVSIDHEKCLSGFGVYNPLESQLLATRAKSKGQHAKDIVFSPESVHHIASRSNLISEEVSKSMPQASRMVNNHARALQEFAQSGQYTLGNLLNILKQQKVVGQPT